MVGAGSTDRTKETAERLEVTPREGKMLKPAVLLATLTHQGTPFQYSTDHSSVSACNRCFYLLNDDLILLYCSTITCFSLCCSPPCSRVCLSVCPILHSSTCIEYLFLDEMFLDSLLSRETSILFNSVGDRRRSLVTDTQSLDDSNVSFFGLSCQVIQ